MVCPWLESSPVWPACAAATAVDASVSLPHTVAMACPRAPDSDGDAAAVVVVLESLEHAASVAASNTMIATIEDRR